ncbi:phosphatidylserine decarboxylase-domain-containing protein [Mycena floridula]|nr:phosphatidylserine decarboxylase-domain-containing protein [Mycena floridula]
MCMLGRWILERSLVWGRLEKLEGLEVIPEEAKEGTPRRILFVLRDGRFVLRLIRLEPDDRAVGGGEDADVCTVGDKVCLESLSIKQGLKYDSPESAAEIPALIAFHGLDVGEVELPLGEYKRQRSYEDMDQGEGVWGGEVVEWETTTSNASGSGLFSTGNSSGAGVASAGTASGPSLGSGLGSASGSGSGSKVGNTDPNAPYYEPTPYLSSTHCIFKLAPQDCHRFHSPVKGVVGRMKRMEGEYYTVNPQAIHTTLDMYSDNVRRVVPIHSEEFGVVMCVCVGAMMVGSIETTVEEGQSVDRRDEFGYLAFDLFLLVGFVLACSVDGSVFQIESELNNPGHPNVQVSGYSSLCPTP